MKETLDVWVIVPLEKPYLKFIVGLRHFHSKAAAERYRNRGGTSYVRDHVILAATLTMETDE